MGLPVIEMTLPGWSFRRSSSAATSLLITVVFCHSGWSRVVETTTFGVPFM